jgi:MOSC domain-containing protein YiiM
MPALVPTRHTGRVVWLGLVPDRMAGLSARPVEEAVALFSGFAGEAHGGLTRPSCSRVTAQHPRGTEIRNSRQVSIVSEEELAEIARRIGLPRLDPAWLGAQMVVRGLPDFSHLPPSSRLQGASGATLVVDMQNRPCHLPARVIDVEAPGAGARFKAAGEGLRGVTAWVEREGPFALGDAVRLHIPDQRAWRAASVEIRPSEEHQGRHRETEGETGVDDERGVHGKDLAKLATKNIGIIT